MKNDFMVFLELLDPGKGIVLNKSLNRAIGVKENIIYSELLNCFLDLRTEDYFSLRPEDLYINTGITKRDQQAAIKNLIDLGLIESKAEEEQDLLYFKINTDFDLISNLIQEG